MIRRLIFLCLALCGLSSPAWADSCVILSVAPIVFGNFTGNTVRVMGSVSFQCAQGSRFAIGISTGSGRGATAFSREMNGANAVLSYGLYSGAAYYNPWGSTPGTGQISGVAATASSVTVPVYAQLPTGQNAPAGRYNDAVAVTISGSFPTSTMAMSINAAVQPACTVSASPMAFGNYAGATLSSTATILATCTSGTAYLIGLNAGTASGAAVNHRSMTGPSTAQLLYGLYRDSGRSLNWGNTANTDTMPGTGNGNPQSLTVYGQIPGGQNSVVAGNYSDTVTVTLTY